MKALERLGALGDLYLNGHDLVRHGGHVTAVSPHFYRVRGLANHVRLGDIVCHDGGAAQDRGEVVQIEGREVVVAPFDDTGHIRAGDPVFADGVLLAEPDDRWLGRVFNAIGEAVDGEVAPMPGKARATARDRRVSLRPLGRERVRTAFHTGVRVIDIFTPLCYGQRLGIFAGSGVGKSTLLAMLARADAFDVVVVALVGERGREVREFLEDAIGPDAMVKTVAVVATSDESAMMRRRAPDFAMRIAEHFRENGKRVLLLIDSITRYAHALREVGISAGEPPVARGYPASVFTDMPRLLERAGPGLSESGSITAIISVLVDGDDHNDPISDSVRGILDGHVVLDRAIADEGRYPPVNPLSSLSRLADKVWSAEERALVLQLRSMMSRFEETRDLRLLGAWQPGMDGALDKAVSTVPVVYEAMCQSPADPVSASPFSDLVDYLKKGGLANGEATESPAAIETAA